MQVFLTTDRLVLRRFTLDDVDNIVELNSDPVVMRYLTGGKSTPRRVVRDQTLPDWLDYYRRPGQFGFWAAQDAATHEFLGWFHFRPPHSGWPTYGSADGIELGYRLRRSAWGKGFATEGSLALIRNGFTELGVDRVFALTMTVNAGSRRVMEKVGLRYVRTLYPQWPDPIPEHEQGLVEYALTKAEWDNQTQPSGLS